MRPMQISHKRILTLIPITVFSSITVVLLQGCKPKKKQFSGSNAYQHVEELVRFGPRIPGTQAIENARLYLEGKLQEFGWITARQSFNDDTPNCLLYTSPSPRDGLLSRMPSSA